jgi:hypothetical protein
VSLPRAVSGGNTFSMHDDWHIYEQMRDSGVSSHDVYKQGQLHDLDRFALIRMLRSVFSLGLGQAKEVMLQADGIASSLSEHEERLLPALKTALQDMENEAEN